MKYEELTIRQKIDYKWMGYVEVDNNNFIKCPIHGELQPATVYGYRQWIECTQCLKIRLEILNRERDERIQNEG